MAEFPIPSFLENQSLDEIHSRMMQHLPKDIDKSEGNHPWNLTRPSAYLGAYFAEFIVPEAIKIFFPKYAENYTEVMDDHAETRGMVRKSATYATGEVTITGKAATEIPADTAFSTASINGEPAVEFVTTEDVIIGVSGTVKAKIKAVEAGTVGNVPAETIILKANKITGISGVTNAEETTGGTEAEDNETLQKRIIEYDASQGVSYVGSEADYKRWAMEVNGIGNVVIIPAEDDTGLITIILTDSAGNPANEDLCTAVYNHIMRPDAPEARLAPVNGGNIVVVAPETVDISVSVTIELDGTTSIEVIKDSILASLKKYMSEAIQDGEVKYTRIGALIAHTEGVNDYKSLLLNNGTSNLSISNQQLPVVEDENLTVTAGNV